MWGIVAVLPRGPNEWDPLTALEQWVEEAIQLVSPAESSFVSQLHLGQRASQVLCHTVPQSKSGPGLCQLAGAMQAAESLRGSLTSLETS
jgi:hypothetical protein